MPTPSLNSKKLNYTIRQPVSSIIPIPWEKRLKTIWSWHIVHPYKWPTGQSNSFNLYSQLWSSPARNLFHDICSPAAFLQCCGWFSAQTPACWRSCWGRTCCCPEAVPGRPWSHRSRLAPHRATPPSRRDRYGSFGSVWSCCSCRGWWPERTWRDCPFRPGWWREDSWGSPSRLQPPGWGRWTARRGTLLPRANVWRSLLRAGRCGSGHEGCSWLRKQWCLMAGAALRLRRNPSRWTERRASDLNLTSTKSGLFGSEGGAV